MWEGGGGIIWTGRRDKVRNAVRYEEKKKKEMNEGEPVKSYSPWNGGGITAIHKWAVKSSIAQGGWRVVGEWWEGG